MCVINLTKENGVIIIMSARQKVDTNEGEVPAKRGSSLIKRKHSNESEMWTFEVLTPC